MAARFVFVNGQLQPEDRIQIEVLSPGWQSGINLLETIYLQEETMPLWRYHIKRLLTGMSQMGFRYSPQALPDYLHMEIMKLAKINQCDGRSKIRLMVYARGNCGKRNALWEPGYLISSHPLDKEYVRFNKKGLHIGVASQVAKGADKFSIFKTANRIGYSMAAQYAKSRLWDDACILNSLGHVIETTRCNLFWVEEGKVFTPPLTEGCVAGVMRQFILKISPEAGITVRQKVCTPAILAEADEIFLSNALRRVNWVESFHNIFYGYDYGYFIYELITKKL